MWSIPVDPALGRSIAPMGHVTSELANLLSEIFTPAISGGLSEERLTADIGTAKVPSNLPAYCPPTP